MENFAELLAVEVAGNHLVEGWGLALAWFLGLFITFRIFRTVILVYLRKLAKKTATIWDDELVKVIEEIPAVFYWFLALYFPVKMLDISELWTQIIDGVFIVVIILQIVASVQMLLFFCLDNFAHKKGDESAFYGIKVALKLLVWSVGLILILSNLGVNVNSLVASLGIGGIAIALALQNILSDIFSSFSIYFDKPFQVGDYIFVGNDNGTVKRIGLKTTRIETLHGEELIISNQELTSARVMNQRKMKRRRVPFNLGFVYSTPVKKLKKVEEIVAAVVDGIDGIELQRCYFKSFGDFALQFEVVIYSLDQTMAFEVEKMHELNISLKEAFEKAKIEMAFPTQTLHLQK